MMTILSIHNLHTIKFTAKQFVSYLNNNPEKVYCFNGKMGAGKTTFIKAICEEMGVKETVNSPTFSIVNEYEAADGNIIYHFDCYRINKIQEALDLGAEEIFIQRKLLLYRMVGKHCLSPTRQYREC